MRPAETYRGARRNAWRDGYHWPTDWSAFKLKGDNWRQPFDDSIIKNKPYAPRGWPYKQGGRLMRNNVKIIWSAPWSVQERIAQIKKLILESK